MLEITDIAYQGGGMVIAFNDNSTVVAVYKIVDGQLTLEGLTDAQETALELFNDAANVDRLTADPRTNLIFGDDFQSEEDLTESSHTGSSGFQVKLEMETPKLAGTYILMWTAQGRVEGAAAPMGRMEMKCRDVTDLTFIEDFAMHQVQNITPSNGGPLKNTFSGHKIIIFTGISRTFDLVWRTKENADTAHIQRARLTLWRLR